PRAPQNRHRAPALRNPPATAAATDGRQRSLHGYWPAESLPEVLMPGYMTPQQQQQLRNNLPPAPNQPKPPNSTGGVPAYSGPPIPAAPPVPPTPLAGIDQAIGRQKANTPAQPISLQGGQVSYNPTTAPYGFDMNTPGVREQFWDRNQNMWFDSPSLDWVDQQLPQFQDPWFGETFNQQNVGAMGAPGAGQQFWNGISGQYNQMSPAEQKLQQGYQGPNNAQIAFDTTRSQLPGSLQPQFDAYYDRMKQKVMSDVNSQSAARGSYGSNTALNNSIGAGLDIEAQRAKAATDFSLDDSANQRAWFDSLGTLGRNADLSGLGIFGANQDAAQYGLDKTKTFGDLAFRAEDTDFNKRKTMSDIAFGIDDSRRQRLDSGISTAFGSDAAHHGQLQDAYGAAGQAQNARETRINNLQNQLAGFSNDVQNFMMQNYDKLLGGDMQMSDQEIEAMIAETADARGWSDQQREVFARDLKGAMEAAGSAKEAGL